MYWVAPGEVHSAGIDIDNGDGGRVGIIRQCHRDDLAIRREGAYLRPATPQVARLRPLSTSQRVMPSTFEVANVRESGENASGQAPPGAGA